MNEDAELRALLAVAAEHKNCSSAQPYIADGKVRIPFDVKDADGRWIVRWEEVRTRSELLEALGYG